MTTDNFARIVTAKLTPENAGRISIAFKKYYIVIYLAILKKIPPPPLFRLKLVYSYVIEVADSEYQLHFNHKPLVSKIFAFYHLLKYARGRPGRRGHVHLGHNFFIQIFLFIMFMRVMRVYVGIYF